MPHLFFKLAHNGPFSFHVTPAGTHSPTRKAQHCTSWPIAQSNMGYGGSTIHTQNGLGVFLRLNDFFKKKILGGGLSKLARIFYSTYDTNYVIN